MTGQSGATVALTPAEMTTRFIAYVIDAVVLAIVYIFLISAILVAALIQGEGGLVALLSRSIIFAVVSFLYFGWGWTSWRATPGQRVMGLLTVNADGSTMNWNQSAMRWAYLFGPSAVASLFSNSQQVGSLLSLIITVALLVYYFYLYRTARDDPKHQGFHDKQSNTIVVKAS